MCSAKTSGLLDVTWDELANILNKELRDDGTELTKDSYRKPYEIAKDWYEQVFSKMVNDEYVKEIQEKKDELFKLKVQYQDQRREYYKQLRIDARAEHLTDTLVEIVRNLNKEKPLDFDKYITQTSDKEAVIAFADWHYGMVTDNLFNTYNVKICRQRVAMFVAKAIKHIKLHKPKKLHILLLGDASHGSIHTSARVASEENTCDQIIHVSELLAEAIGKLASEVEFTYVYSTYGNHLRTIQNKKDSIHSDNMEKLIPWWLKERFQLRNDIEIVEADYKEFIKLNVCGYTICATHGDLDKFKNLGTTVNTLFSKVYGETIDYTISADKHHLEEFEAFGIENILVRSLAGTDDYANELRLYSKAGQSLFIFSEEEGRECTYNIKLN